LSDEQIAERNEYQKKRNAFHWMYCGERLFRASKAAHRGHRVRERGRSYRVHLCPPAPLCVLPFSPTQCRTSRASD